MKLLADTSALLALILRDDRHHPRAVQFVRENPAARFVITDLILSEVVTRARARAGVAQAVRIGAELLRSTRYEVIFADSVLLSGGLSLMAKYHDERLSLPDCVSFEVMTRLGLDAAFSFDSDFEDCGFRMLP